ncbi:hypothetical protein ABZ297_23875 [Nonomuraea sp. NPDC005983]|uniref:hypothetical protein n=1 Tax=Nonomuraea sp. NPDC005983 TaxID=3155595 RepID=UPI0033A18459
MLFGKTAKWGAAVLRVRRVAYAGAIVTIGLVGCSASAETTPTATPSGTATSSTSATPTGSPPATRKAIDVQLNPDSVTAGETSKVWILANCPVPTGGPAHTGTATSKAFISGVSLNPVPASSATPTATGAPANTPWVRGEAQVSGTVKRGSYSVDVKCDGTNDIGKATLKVVKAEALPTGVPTKAPRAGGGGTYAKDVSDESTVPLGPAGVVLGLALAAGIGVAIKRRRA